MKSKKKIKVELHKKTDNIEDEHLTEEQEKELDEAIRQIENGVTITWEEFLNSTQHWHKHNY